MQFIDIHSKLKLAYTEIEDGNIDERFSSKTEVKENRKKVLKAFGAKPYDIIEAKQVHNTLILPLNSENTKMWRGHNITGVDGFVTDQKDSVILLRVADCVPLVVYDPEHNAVGVFHVGWRGAVKDFHLLGLETMEKYHDSSPRQLIAWIGPSAQDCCYISKQKPDQASEPEWQPFIKKRKNQWMIDIPGYISSTLNKAGVYKKNLHLSPDCTIDSENLFSHQRSQSDDTKEGRIGVLVQLK